MKACLKVNAVIIGLWMFLTHSTSSISPYAMQIMLGEHNVRVFEGTEQLMKTDTIIWHPEWVEIFHSCCDIILQLTNVLTQMSNSMSHSKLCSYFSTCSYDYQTLDYDIMLIKLFNPVEVTESVAPISLPLGCPYGGMPCSVSGWGNTASSGDGGLLTMIHWFVSDGVFKIKPGNISKAGMSTE